MERVGVACDEGFAKALTSPGKARWTSSRQLGFVFCLTHGLLRIKEKPPINLYDCWANTSTPVRTQTVGQKNITAEQRCILTASAESGSGCSAFNVVDLDRSDWTYPSHSRLFSRVILHYIDHRGQRQRGNSRRKSSGGNGTDTCASVRSTSARRHIAWDSGRFEVAWGENCV